MFERESMLKQIQELGFILVDLNLYLDTHPTCRKAIADFNTISNNLDRLKKKYEAKYGPLMVDGFTENRNCWTWVDEKTPWPWERMKEVKCNVGL